MIRVTDPVRANPLHEGSAKEHSGVADLRDAAARWRAPDVGPPAARSDLGNVILFARTRRDGAAASAAPELPTAVRSSVIVAEPRRALRWAALLTASVAAHVALYLPFGREPIPMASLGEVAVSVELVLGANQEAGLTPDKGTAEASAPAPAQAPDAVAEQPPEPPASEVAKVEPVPEQPQTAVETAQVQTTQVQTTQIEVAQVEAAQVETETPPQEVIEKTEPAEKPPVQVAALPVEPEPSPPQPVAPVEAAPEPTAPAQVQAAPTATVAPAAELQAAVNPETPPTVAVVPPREAVKPPPEPAKPQVKPAFKKPDVKPPVVREKRKPETRSAAVRGERNDSRTTSPASTAAGGAGRGRSEANSNYSGQVHAHLRRFLRYPDEARSRGERGTASVAFTVDAGGRVTSVRLVRGVGSAALDREATAVVRRASPFPAPPSGSAHSFTAPVGFNLN